MAYKYYFVLAHFKRIVHPKIYSLSHFFPNLYTFLYTKNILRFVTKQFWSAIDFHSEKNTMEYYF